MSALTEQVAREHQRIFNARRGLGPHCTCGWVRPGYDGSREHAQHIAEVTEQAVRAELAEVWDEAVDWLDAGNDPDQIDMRSANPYRIESQETP